MRKIDLMHAKFGKEKGTCKNCTNLVRTWRTKPRFKCKVYGFTHSEASDWRASYEACGMKNTLWTGGNIIECVTPEKPILEQLVGQCELEV